MRLVVSPTSRPCKVTATIAPLSRSISCSALRARCVRPSFIFVILASGSNGFFPDLARRPLLAPPIEPRQRLARPRLEAGLPGERVRSPGSPASRRGRARRWRGSIGGARSGRRARSGKNPFDPDAKITKMKDGRTHLALKAEHEIDLDSGAMVAVTLQGLDVGDTTSLIETAIAAAQVEAAHAERSTSAALTELVADRGYHSNQTMIELDAAVGVRSYIARTR